MRAGSPSPNLDPYARLAAAYDAEFDDAEADVAGYSSRLLGGRVLIVGCGTGRINRRLHGLAEVVGLDRSPDMIAAARARGPTSLRYEVGDLLDFNLGTFADVILPNGTFAFLRTRAERAQALATLRRACPEGQLTLDLPTPDVALLGHPHTPERPAWAGMVDGRAVRRTREVFRFPLAQRVELVDRFYDDTDACFTKSMLVLHLFWPDELEWMLEANGLYVDATYGDHRGGPVREGCDRLIVVARTLR